MGWPARRQAKRQAGRQGAQRARLRGGSQAETRLYLASDVLPHMQAASWQDVAGRGARHGARRRHGHCVRCRAAAGSSQRANQRKSCTAAAAGGSLWLRGVAARGCRVAELGEERGSAVCCPLHLHLVDQQEVVCSVGRLEGQYRLAAARRGTRASSARGWCTRARRNHACRSHGAQALRIAGQPSRGLDRAPGLMSR